MFRVRHQPSGPWMTSKDVIPAAPVLSWLISPLEEDQSQELRFWDRNWPAPEALYLKSNFLRFIFAGAFESVTTVPREVRIRFHLRVDLFQRGEDEAPNGTLKPLALKNDMMLFGTQVDLVWKAYDTACHWVTFGKSLNMYVLQIPYSLNESHDIHLMVLSWGLYEINTVKHPVHNSCSTNGCFSYDLSPSLIREAASPCAVILTCPRLTITECLHPQHTQSFSCQEGLSQPAFTVLLEVIPQVSGPGVSKQQESYV